MLRSLVSGFLALNAFIEPPFVSANVIRDSNVPTVILDQGVFTGAINGSVEKFLSIPFAKPPTGNLRFRPPVPIPTYNGSFQVTAYGNACPQQASQVDLNFTALPQSIADLFAGLTQNTQPQSEDCLTIDVLRPTGIASNATSKLPVVVWIYGGGFEFGSTSMTSYDGTPIVQHSVALGKPVIFVAMNYRISGFGFLTGREVKTAGAGNLGLRDQREALRWVQKYISAFGGDRKKVTIWGESAGSFSVGFHMVANQGNTENLFNAAFMQSGAIPQFDAIDSASGQDAYDAVVSQTGCAGSADTLACLRLVPYDTLKSAFDAGPGLFSYKSLFSSWLPRPDGNFITDFPQSLLAAGKVARVPFICGDTEDEGTLFSLSSTNVTTDSEFCTYIKYAFFSKVPQNDLDALALAYPDDVTQGSPFNTGTNNSITPQSKRLAAIQGDLLFDAPRRYLLEQSVGKQNSWSYLYKRTKSTPYLGAQHASDVPDMFSGGDMTDYLINFVVYSDPNGGTGMYWPQYNATVPSTLTFLDGPVPLTVSLDTFRKQAMALLTKVSIKYPL